MKKSKKKSLIEQDIEWLNQGCKVGSIDFSNQISRKAMFELLIKQGHWPPVNAEVWQPTMNLRWHTTDIDFRLQYQRPNYITLQQEWTCGDKKEWRDVK